MTAGLEAQPPATSETDQLRERAVKRLRKRRDLGTHALVFVLVNAFLVGIWLMTGDGGFFWPIFPMAGWGIGLAMNAWDVWRGDEFAPAAIERQMRRLQNGR
jgi:2TM domain-containing protein